MNTLNLIPLRIYLHEDSRPIYCDMEIEGQHVTMQIDRGATVSTLPLEYVKHKEIHQEAITLKMLDGNLSKGFGRCVVKMIKSKK